VYLILELKSKDKIGASGVSSDKNYGRKWVESHGSGLVELVSDQNRNRCGHAGLAFVRAVWFILGDQFSLARTVKATIRLFNFTPRISLAQP